MGIKDLFFKNKNYSSVGIEPSKEMQERYNKQIDVTLDYFLKLLVDSGRFNAYEIEKLVKRNKDIVFKSITDGKLLDLTAKKKLNINSRKKVGDIYVQTLTDKGKIENASIDFFKNTYYQAFGIISRKYKLLELKRAGVKKCKISSSHDERDCPHVKRYENKSFDIDEVPNLPLEGCTAIYCRCVFVASLDD